MATKAELIRQMQARLEQFNAAFDPLRAATTAIATANPAAVAPNSIANAIAAADGLAGVGAVLDDLVTDIELIDLNFDTAANGVDLAAEKRGRDAILLQARQQQRALAAERERLAQVKRVGQQTQVFYNALGEDHPSVPGPTVDDVAVARDTQATRVREAAQTVVAAYGDAFNNAARASENAILVIRERAQIDTAQGNLAALNVQLTNIKNARGEHTRKVDEAKTHLRANPWECPNNCTEFQAMEAQQAALKALEDAAQAEYDRQNTLLTAMQEYGNRVTQFEERLAAANTDTNNAALIAMANAIATGDDHPRNVAIEDAIRVAGEARDALRVRIDAIPAQADLESQARLAKDALTTAGGADSHSYDDQIAEIDAALQARLEARQAKIEAFTRQQDQLTQLTAYANAAKEGPLSRLTEAAVDHAAELETLTNALKSAGGHALDLVNTPAAIRDARRAVEQFETRVVAARAAYTAYQTAATAAKIALGAPPGGLDQADRVAAIEARLATLEERLDAAENNLQALQAAQITQLVARDTAVFDEKKAGDAGITKTQAEFKEASEAYEKLQKRTPKPDTHEEDLAEAKEKFETKRAAFVTAVNGYKIIAQLTGARLEAIGTVESLAEAAKIKKQYDDLLTEATSDLTALHDKANTTMGAVRAVTLATVLPDSIPAGTTIVYAINTYVAILRSPGSESTERKRLYDYLNLREGEFRKAKEAHDEYIKAVNAAIDKLPATDPKRAELQTEKAAREAIMATKVAERKPVVELLAHNFQTKVMNPTSPPAVYKGLDEIKRLDNLILAGEGEIFKLRAEMQEAPTVDLVKQAELKKVQDRLAENQAKRAEVVDRLNRTFNITTDFGHVRELGKHLLYLQDQYHDRLTYKQAELDVNLRLYAHFKGETEKALQELKDLKAAHEAAIGADPNYGATPEAQEKLNDMAALESKISGFYGRANGHLKAAEALQKKIVEEGNRLEKETQDLLNASSPDALAIRTAIGEVNTQIDTLKDAVATRKAEVEGHRTACNTLEGQVKGAGVQVVSSETKSCDIATPEIPVNRLYQSMLAAQNSTDPKKKPILEKLEKGEDLSAEDMKTLTGDPTGAVDPYQFDKKEIGRCTFEYNKETGILKGTVKHEFSIIIDRKDKGTVCEVCTESGGHLTQKQKFEAGVTEAMTLLKKAGCKVVCIDNVTHKGDRIPMISKALKLGQAVAMEDGDSTSSQGARMWKAYQLLARHDSSYVSKDSDRYVDLLAKPENDALLDEFLDGVIEKGHCTDKDMADRGEKGVIVYWGADGNGPGRVLTKDDLKYMVTCANATPPQPQKLIELKEILRAQAKKEGSFLKMGVFNKDRERVGLSAETRLGNIRAHAASISLGR